jgi:ABC-type transport system substrate-binding protein
MPCKSRPPFNDIRIRQALNYALDRKALNDTVYEGKGEPMWGFWKADSPNHDKRLDNYYAYDLDKAKRLLAEAGQPNLTFEMFFTTALSDSQRAAEVVQQQWARAGVKVNLKPIVQQQDFFPDAKGAPMQFFPLQRSGHSKVSRVFLPGSFGNVCGWDDPELTRLVRGVQAVAEDSPEAAKLWSQVSEQALKTAVTIFGLFGVQARAWNDTRIGNVAFYEDRTGATLDYHSIYIKK